MICKIEHQYKIYHLNDNENTQRFIDIIKEKEYYLIKELDSFVFRLNDFIIKGICYSIYNRKADYKEGVIHENMLIVNRDFITRGFCKLDEIAINFEIK